MVRTLEVELFIRDQSGCPLGTKREEFSAIEDNRNWIVQRIKPEKNRKKGEGGSRKQAIIDWLIKNIY